MANNSNCYCKKYYWSLKTFPTTIPPLRIQWVDCNGRLHTVRNINHISGVIDCTSITPRFLLNNNTIFRGITLIDGECCCTCYSLNTNTLGCGSRVRDCRTGQYYYTYIDPDTPTQVCSSIIPQSRCLIPIVGNDCLFNYSNGTYVCELPTTTTTTLPFVVLNECDVLFVGDNKIYLYDSQSNTVTILNPYINNISPLYNNTQYWIVDIAHTMSYIWTFVSDQTNSTNSQIHEYIITSTSPFSASFSRTIYFPNMINGFCAKNDTTLIVFTMSNPIIFCSPNQIVELDISGTIPIPNYQMISPNNRIFVGGDLMYTTNGKLLTSTFNCYTYDNYLTQYDYSSQTIEVDVINNDISLGIYQQNGEIFLLNQGGVIQNINQNYPYKITDITTISINGIQIYFDGASQMPTCCTVSLIP